MSYASTLRQFRAFGGLTILCLDRELAEIWFGGLPSFFRCDFLWRLLARRHSLLGRSNLFRDFSLLCDGFLRYDLLAKGSLLRSGTLGGCTRGGASLKVKNLWDVSAEVSDRRNLAASW
jgi:hypothetical protein